MSISMLQEGTELQQRQAIDAGIIDKDTFFEGFWSFKPTWIFQQFINRPEKIIGLFSGNQFGKSSSVAYSYVLRILGMHPVEHKNMRPDNPIRTYRFASETLPSDSDGGEVKNTQYPEFMKWLPKHLIKKDITVRRPVVDVHDPQGGPDIHIDFTSFGQTTQSQAGQKRASVWIDEGASKEFYEEQLPRLLAADGDLIYTLTPAEYVGFEFDEIFERASVYIRTQAVRDRIKKRYGRDVPEIETRDGFDIAVLMAATDDNPILSAKSVNSMFELLADEDTIDIRRYGLFRQASGQIFKDFDVRTHVISANQYFPEWVPHGWMHARGIDYHEHVPWACLFVTQSPNNEVFVYDELNPSPETMVTLQIAQILAGKSKDYKYYLNLIDPLAAKKQSNTGLSTIDDLNRIFSQFRKEGTCTGGYWQSWDTKSTRGREEIRTRLRNSKLCGKPFNNRIIKDGIATYLPTLWILDNCHKTKESFKNWRKEEWNSREALLTKDEKDRPQQRFSHFPMVVEALFKHSIFATANHNERILKDRDTQHKHYFQKEAYGR